MLVALVGVVIFMLWEFSLPFNSLTSLSAGTISNWDDASPVRVWQQIRQQENVQGAKLEQQDQQPLQDQQQEHLDVSIAQNDPLAYRKKLETRFAGYNYTLGSSRTSTFDSIYTLSLAGQTKRQEQMHRIADALGFKFKIFEATSMRLPKIAWIAERVKEIRDKKRDIIGSALKRPAESIGGMGADSIWFQEEDFSKDIAFPDLSLHDKRWIVDGTAHNWTDYLWMQESRGKDPQPSNQSIDIVKLLWDPVEPEAFRQHSPPIIATWHSHTSMWRHMLDRGEKTALFLEDDVDFEWDFERLWLNALRVLPQDWEIVFLGHCWARTRNKPMYLNPIVREAAEPRCLHAYALSAAGAEHLLRLVNSPWIAYQSAIDLLVPKLIRQRRIKAFVTEPPLVIQSKDSPSSIQPGTGSPWRGLLMDSTLDRIWRDAGESVQRLTWAETRDDPCIWNS